MEVANFHEIVKKGIVLDVRPELEFRMCKLPHTINFPLSKIEKNENLDYLKTCIEQTTSDGNKNGLYFKYLWH